MVRIYRSNIKINIHIPNSYFEYDKLFWENYINYGRCIIDIDHIMIFKDSQLRWHYNKNIRTCNWCKNFKQQKIYLEQWEIIK